MICLVKQPQLWGDSREFVSTDNFVVPFERNPLFAGRKEFLKTLKQTLYDRAPKKYCHRVALYGMGGIGKTQTVLEYVYSNRESYDRIYWITAVDQATLLFGYENIAKKAGLKTPVNATPICIAEQVISWLHQQKQWLIVIDNLDDITVVAGFLPPNGLHQHTLITTRNPNSRGIPAEGLEVPLLDAVDSVDLLSTLSNISIIPNSAEHEQAAQIVEELGHLPLAIEQAAAYLREAAGDFTTFLEDYHNSRPELHKWVPTGNRQYSFSVATTWSMSFNLVRKSDPQAAKLFQLLAFLNPDCIRIDFLASGAQVLDSDLQNIVSNPIDRAKALIQLEKFSLLKWNRAEKSLVVHRLVQAVMIDEMSGEERTTLSTTVVNLCHDYFPMDWTNDTRPICRIYVSQLLTPLLNIKSLSDLNSPALRSPNYVDVITRVGRFLLNDGKNNDSASLLGLAQNVQYEIFGPNHPNTLEAMSHLAGAYRDQGRIAEAAQLKETVLEKSKEILGEEDIKTFRAMANLAVTYCDQGRMTAAAQLQETVLEKYKAFFGEKDPNTFNAMINLSMSYHHLGKLTEATKLKELVLGMRRVVLGEDHEKTIGAMANLAVSYHCEGRLAEAQLLKENALKENKRIFDDDHTETLRYMIMLANTYHAQGRMVDAMQLQETALEKCKQIFGDKHLETLRLMANLAVTYHTQGQMTKATDLKENVLKKNKQILGDDHPDTLRAMASLASAYQIQERITEAAQLNQILEKSKQILEDKHPNSLIWMTNLESMYGYHGQIEDISKCHK